MLKHNFCYIIIVGCIVGIAEGLPVFSEQQQPYESNAKSLTKDEVNLFEKLISPTDTRLQQDTKLLLAQYLAQQVNAPPAPVPAPQNPVPVPAPQSQTPVPVPVEIPETTVFVESTTEAITSTAIPTTVTVASTAQPVTIPSVILGSTIRPAGPPNHVLNQVDKILGSVSQGNVVGIVDNALGIRAPAPVRNLVVGILNLIFCNPVDRYLSRCNSAGSSANAASTAMGIIGK